MGVNANNVFVGAPDQETTGAIQSGPRTDTIPLTIDDLPDVGYVDSGYVDEEGVTITPSESTESIRDWSLKVIRKVLTEFDGTLGWAHLELSAEALRNYMGDEQVEVTAATATEGTRTRAALAGKQRPVKSWIFRMKDGDRRAAILVPHGQVTERGEISLVASGAIKLPVTLTTYPDAAGNNIYIFTDDGVVSTGV